MADTTTHAMTRSTAVRCTGIVRDFGDGGQTTRVLHGIDLEVQLGELLMLVGQSGCGKTTLISIIGGILGATAGEVSVFDQPLSALKGADLVRFRLKHMGFIFQQYNLLPTLTAAENACVPLAAMGMARKPALARARNLLERLGLGPHADKLPNQLSGGQQQRVAIARALVHAPRLVICDEPTAALDAASGRQVVELIRDVAVTPNCACVVVTHDNRIFENASRIVEMEDGRVKATHLPDAQHSFASRIH
jgi:putative ABC transport system ATP-binding protein